jgi:hypothetical protein
MSDDQNAPVVHAGSSITFKIKSGNLEFKETQKYKLADGATSTDNYPGHCDLNSDKLKEWAHSVIDSFIDSKSVRPEAVSVDPDN